MKKILSVMLMFVLLMSLTIPAFAGSKVKEVEVAIKALPTKVNAGLQASSTEVSVGIQASPATVNSGESIELTAVTPKHGSSFTDSWSIAEKSGTTLDVDTGCYISKAVFKAAEPGEYTIEYNITMDAGSSDVLFIGRGSFTVKVIGVTNTVIGAKISIDTLSKKDINGITYYNATGNEYAIWSNGEESPSIGFISINFGVNDSYKDINVKIGDCTYIVRVEKAVGTYFSNQ